MSTGPQYIEPNLYELSGGNLTIQYSTTSAAGVPTFSFQRGNIRKSYRGDEIRAMETELGRLITVTVDVVPDLHTITLTLVVPGMNLDGSDGTIQAFAVVTTGTTSIGGPRLVKGQFTRHEVVQLAGQAHAIKH